MIAAGIDTHKDFHIMVLADELGREVSHHRISADPEGYAAAVRILKDAGEVGIVGIEGTGSYGAGISRHLMAAGYQVAEVCRPKRSRRRPSEDKSDPADALRAARDALRDEGLGRTPKDQGGCAEALRVLGAAYKGAVKARTAHINALKGLIVSAPDAIRERLRHLPDKDLIRTCARKRACADVVEGATWGALRALALMWRCADEQARTLLEQMEGILCANAPALLKTFGVGVVSGSDLFAAAGDNPERLAKGEASFAAICGASCVDASTGGPNTRHRLNRGGNRQANAALYRIAIVRMGFDDETRAYVEKRTAEGKNKREIIRCLKRSIAREIYKVLKNPFGEPRRARQKRS